MGCGVMEEACLLHTGGRQSRRHALEAASALGMPCLSAAQHAAHDGRPPAPAAPPAPSPLCARLIAAVPVPGSAPLTLSLPVELYGGPLASWCLLSGPATYHSLWKQTPHLLVPFKLSLMSLSSVFVKFLQSVLAPTRGFFMKPHEIS